MIFQQHIKQSQKNAICLPSQSCPGLSGFAKVENLRPHKLLHLLVEIREKLAGLGNPIICQRDMSGSPHYVGSSDRNHAACRRRPQGVDLVIQIFFRRGWENTSAEVRHQWDWHPPVLELTIDHHLQDHAIFSAVPRPAANAVPSLLDGQ